MRDVKFTSQIWRKVRAPKPATKIGGSANIFGGSSVAANSRPPKGEDYPSRHQRKRVALGIAPDENDGVRATETSLRHDFWRRVKRGNLYAEQDQIGPNPGVARAYRKLIGIGTGKVAGPLEQSKG